MTKKLISAISLLSLLFCQSPNGQPALKTDNAASASIKYTEVWQLLFDGKSTNGWHTYGKTTVGKSWTIDHGSLYLDVTNKSREESGDLVTDGEFKISLESQIA
jgi:hypothetical protein